MQHFIEKANQLGQQKTPFFFLIDFEQKNRLSIRLQQWKRAEFYLIFHIKKII